MYIDQINAVVKMVPTAGETVLEYYDENGRDYHLFISDRNGDSRAIAIRRHWDDVYSWGLKIK